MVSQQIKIAMVAAALVAFAYIVPHSGSFVVLLATRAMAFAILAMSVDLLLGYTGLASMGQAAYFGIGAYLTAILAARYRDGRRRPGGVRLYRSAFGLVRRAAGDARDGLRHPRHERRPPARLYRPRIDGASCLFRCEAGI